MQAICFGCIKVSVESVAESLIIRYNVRNSNSRSIGEEAAHDEVMISCNGPETAECKIILESALNK